MMSKDKKEAVKLQDVLGLVHQVSKELKIKPEKALLLLILWELKCLHEHKDIEHAGVSALLALVSRSIGQEGQSQT